MKSLLTILFLGIFLVYSQGMLVMWCLYFIEQHDIVMYYCNEHDSTNGTSYVHKLCDAAKGEHTGALALIKIVDNHTTYSPAHNQYRFIAHQQSTTHWVPNAELYQSPHPNSLFKPPYFS